MWPEEKEVNFGRLKYKQEKQPFAYGVCVPFRKKSEDF